MLLYHQWIQLPLVTRAKIANLFGIEKKGATEVFSNTIKSDGYLIKDVETGLNLVSLQKFLGTEETDFRVLWDLLIAKIDGRIVETPKEVINPPKLDTPPLPPLKDVAPPVKNKGGRPKGSKNKPKNA